MIAAVLFVMWEECFRRALHAIISPLPGEGLSSRVEVLFWLGRELVWWWLVVGLAALVLSAIYQPLVDHRRVVVITNPDTSA
jgi:hypothetical protein